MILPPDIANPAGSDDFQTENYIGNPEKNNK
jgi:hypothetical protein